MGFFTKQASSGGLASLNKDRLKAVLDGRGANYAEDDDGDVGGYWDGHLFYFFVTGQSGEYFQVRARWNREVAMSEWMTMLALINQWNTEKFWPKCYARAETRDGEDAEPTRIGVYTEVNVDYEHGLTDEQLDQHLACAIATSGSFFDFLDEHYPEEAARAKAEYENG